MTQGTSGPQEPLDATLATERRGLAGTQAWHRRVGGLHVLKLAGSHYEMGRQHGALLADAVRQGPMPYFRTFVQRLLGRSLPGPLSPVVWAVLTRVLGRRIERSFPEPVLAAVRGLADGSGLPLGEVLQGCTMPDALVWLASKLMRVKRVGPAVHHRLALGLGCTSAIAWGEATRDGKLLHGRNTDYHGVACWPETAAVIFHEPDEGQRYVSVGAAGVLLAGAAAMNEAGLTLTIHQHMFSNGAELGGAAIGGAAELVMRHATNLDEAQAILARHRPIGCWTYLVADGKAREVLCWEENPRRHAALRVETGRETFGYSNIYLDPELGDTEVALYGSYWRHNQGRYAQVNGRLRAERRTLDPQAMTTILGDEGRTSCRLRDAIAMLETVSSMVFRPEDGTLWVATGAVPVSQNAYLPFSLGTEDHAPEAGVLEGGRPSDAPSAAAYAAYRDAFLAYLDRDDLGESRQCMARARGLAPSQPLYAFLGGLLAVEAGDTGEAIEAFDRALELGHADPERIAAFHLWRARAFDLRGDRDRARAGYARVENLPADDPVRRAARRGLDRPFKAREAGRMRVEFSFADVVAP